MTLEDSSVQAARQAVCNILHINQTPALQLASSFDQYLHLLANDVDALLAKFAKQAEPPAVEEYEAHLTKCQEAAEAIRSAKSCSMSKIRIGKATHWHAYTKC